MRSPTSGWIPEGTAQRFPNREAELRRREIPIHDLPLYSYDCDANYPPEGRALKDAIAHRGATTMALRDFGPQRRGSGSLSRASRRRTSATLG